jgi:acyl-coenzyme A synthetase/AMP-(fatty) acid ligase
MRMPQSNPSSLWNAVVASGDDSNSFIGSAEACVQWSTLSTDSLLDGRADELRGCSVVIVTSNQFTAALTLFELDGIARRIILYPGELTLDHLPFVVNAAEVDAIVSDRTTFGPTIPHVRYFMPCVHKLVPHNYDRNLQCQTEWVLLTSGTMGPPKLVVHTLSSLIGVIRCNESQHAKVVWSTFYDIRRYGGLQIFLRAALTGASLILSSVEESTVDFLARVASHGVTHISGTPSHWRRALMSPSAQLMSPEYVRLSGEIADQGILNQLKTVYPQANIAHAFATTEAGVAFEVNDGESGFPADVIEQTPNVEMKVENRTLRIRSSRTADRYLGDNAPVLKAADGFVDTRDMVELREGRYYFVGRYDGIINVGGLKVHPEEVEAVINRHPYVHMSLVRAKKNPVTGAIVIADVILSAAAQSRKSNRNTLQEEITQFCRESLSSYKVPAMINFVPVLPISESGKIVRSNA